MRADRLIAELMLIQARGRMTARALAREVEVTEPDNLPRYRGLEHLRCANLHTAWTGRGYLIGGVIPHNLTGMRGVNARFVYA